MELALILAFQTKINPAALAAANFNATAHAQQTLQLMLNHAALAAAQLFATAQHAAFQLHLIMEYPADNAIMEILIAQVIVQEMDQPAVILQDGITQAHHAALADSSSNTATDAVFNSNFNAQVKASALLEQVNA